MNKIKNVILFVFSLMISITATASRDLPHPKSFLLDYQSRKAIKNKSPEKALENNLKILELDTDIPQVHSNLGIVFDQMNKPEQAEKSFNEALRLTEKAQKKHQGSISLTNRFQVYYNLGVFYGQKKEIEKALGFYQSALDINPTSTETKHNIELLIQSQQDKKQQKKSDDEKKEGDSGNDQNDKQDQKGDQKKDKGQDRKTTPKYQPRPFKGEQLGEADVKKILGELSQQDRKIRSQYNKKEQQRENRNAKDW